MKAVSSVPKPGGGLSWIDHDNVFVYADFGPARLTQSGYPRIVKRWRRGTPLQSGSVVYEGFADDMYIAAIHDDTPGFERELVIRTLSFYEEKIYLIGADGRLARVKGPNSTNKSVYREWITLELREPWIVGGRTYLAGSLLVTRFEDFMAGKRPLNVLFEPNDTTSLAGFSWT